MFSISRSLPVNPPGTTSPISRAEVWKGLVLKADNALPFVPSMTYCKVLERENDKQFIREIEFRGDRMKERITLEPEKKVTFERLSGPVLGTIRNFIDETPNGDLELRFAFELEVKGAAAGSQEEKDYAANMEKAYLGAVDATLAAIRKIHDESTGAGNGSFKQPSPPEWVRSYYADVDGMKMPEFLAHHAADARVTAGNYPTAVGHEQIAGAIGGLWGSIAGLNHKFINTWMDGPRTAILEVAVTYHRKDGKSVTVPCVSILQQNDQGKVQELRFHIDLAPVFAP